MDRDFGFPLVGLGTSLGVLLPQVHLTVLESDVHVVVFLNESEELHLQGGLLLLLFGRHAFQSLLLTRRKFSTMKIG